MGLAPIRTYGKILKAMEMAQGQRCLLCDQEDMSSDP